MKSRLKSPLAFVVFAFIVLAAMGIATDGVLDFIIELGRRGTPVAR